MAKYLREVADALEATHQDVDAVAIIVRDGRGRVVESHAELSDERLLAALRITT